MLSEHIGGRPLSSRKYFNVTTSVWQSLPLPLLSLSVSVSINSGHFFPFCSFLWGIVVSEKLEMGNVERPDIRE